MPKIAVPITPAVLDWAISDSGFSVEQIAEEAGVQLADLNDWLSAKSQPGVTEVRALVQALRRPVAALLLPKPPDSRTPAVGFRHTPGVAGRSLSPKERRYLRKAARLQAMLAAMAVEMGEAGPRQPQLDTSCSAPAQPDGVAHLGVRHLVVDRCALIVLPRRAGSRHECACDSRRRRGVATASQPSLARQ